MVVTIGGLEQGEEGLLDQVLPVFAGVGRGGALRTRQAVVVYYQLVARVGGVLEHAPVVLGQNSELCRKLGEGRDGFTEVVGAIEGPLAQYPARLPLLRR